MGVPDGRSRERSEVEVLDDLSWERSVVVSDESSEWSEGIQALGWHSERWLVAL